MIDLLSQDHKVTPEHLRKYLKLSDQAKKIKKEKDALGKFIKDNIEPNEKYQAGNINARLIVSERTILSPKKIKEDYPTIYQTYGVIQEVISLKVEED